MSESQTRSIAHTIDLYKAYRAYVEHEDGLTNNRISWMLTIHGFLYASYGFTLQKKLEIASKIVEPVSWSSIISSALIPTLAQVEAFLLAISAVGLAISWAALKSIIAASRAINSVRSIYEANVAELPMFSGLAGSRERHHVHFLEGRAVVPALAGGGFNSAREAGLSASTKIPIILMISWIFAFVIQLCYWGWIYIMLFST